MGQDPHPVHVRHSKVRHDRIDALRGQCLDRFAARRGAQGDVADLIEPVGQAASHFKVVVDDQNTRGTTHFRDPEVGGESRPWCREATRAIV